MTRGQGEHQDKGETKQNIIEFILSRPSLFVEEPALRDYLKEKHDIREPKNIKRLLKELSKRNFITKTEERGLENKWSIENPMQLQIIVKEYNDITKIMQKNDKIISMLINQHFKPYYFKEIYEMYKIFKECEKCLESPQRPNDIDCNLNLEEKSKCIDLEKKNQSDSGNYLNVRQSSARKTMDDKIKKTVNNFNSKFTEYLKISPCFFKMCLKIPEEFENTFQTIFNLQMKNRFNSELFLNPFEENISIEDGLLNYYYNVFQICVDTDIT